MEIAEKVVAKIRSLAKFNPDIASVLNDANKPLATVKYDEDKDGKLHLRSISFMSWDCIYAYEDGLCFYPEHGNIRKIISYNSWEEFLNM